MAVSPPPASLSATALARRRLQVEHIPRPHRAGRVFYGFEHDMTDSRYAATTKDRSAALVGSPAPTARSSSTSGPCSTSTTSSAPRSPPWSPGPNLATTSTSPRPSTATPARSDRARPPEANPDLTTEAHDALRRLDRLPDAVFALYRLTPAQAQACASPSRTGRVAPTACERPCETRRCQALRSYSNPTGGHDVRR